MAHHDTTTRLALCCGDPAGIGPEIVVQALERASLGDGVRVLVLGPERCRPADVPALGDPVEFDAPDAPRRAWHATWAPPSWEMGRVQAGCGRAALEALRVGHELATSGRVDALVTAPVSKEALHAAGERVEGQTELLGRWAGCEVDMLAVAGRLRVLLHTRHLPLAQAISGLEPNRIVKKLHVLHTGLVGLGISSPRLALAGLNPHAGENGILGREELDVLAPAAERARADGLDVTGPESPDTVFLRASQGRFDGVLALYHDQGFIPVKLARPDGGLTVLLGLPYLRVSPAHGTAFDIAGRCVARPDNLVEALEQAARWAAAGDGGIGASAAHRPSRLR